MNDKFIMRKISAKTTSKLNNLQYLHKQTVNLPFCSVYAIITVRVISLDLIYSLGFKVVETIYLGNIWTITVVFLISNIFTNIVAI